MQIKTVTVNRNEIKSKDFFGKRLTTHYIRYWNLHTQNNHMRLTLIKRMSFGCFVVTKKSCRKLFWMHFSSAVRWKSLCHNIFYPFHFISIVLLFCCSTINFLEMNKRIHLRSMSFGIAAVAACDRMKWKNAERMTEWIEVIVYMCINWRLLFSMD